MSDGVYGYDKTAGNNTERDGVSIQEGMNAANVNNAMRGGDAEIARYRDDTGGQLSSAGTANVQTITTNSGLTTLKDGLRIHFVAGVTNTGATTLNVDALGAKAVRKGEDEPLTGNEIRDKQHHILEYDSSANGAAGAWILLNPYPSTVSVNDGTAAAPSYSFLNNTGLGFYRVSSNHIGVTAAGAQILSILGNRLQPAVTNAYDLGTVNNRFNNLFVNFVNLQLGSESELGIRRSGSNQFEMLTDGTSRQVVLNNRMQPATDNSYDLGTSSVRYKAVYAASGVITTSDKREKTDIRPTSEAEKRVARSLLTKFGFFRFLSEDPNGPETFGLYAQDIVEAFAAEGLNADNYTMIDRSEWEENGETRSRLGIRSDQLALFFISVLATR